jgi:hypothetical protein
MTPCVMTGEGMVGQGEAVRLLVEHAYSHVSMSASPCAMLVAVAPIDDRMIQGVDLQNPG